MIFVLVVLVVLICIVLHIIAAEQETKLYELKDEAEEQLARYILDLHPNITDTQLEGIIVEVLLSYEFYKLFLNFKADTVDTMFPKLLDRADVLLLEYKE